MNKSCQSRLAMSTKKMNEGRGSFVLYNSKARGNLVAFKEYNTSKFSCLIRYI